MAETRRGREEKLLTTAQAAEYFGVDRRTKPPGIGQPNLEMRQVRSLSGRRTAVVRQRGSLGHLRAELGGDLLSLQHLKCLVAEVPEEDVDEVAAAFTAARNVRRGTPSPPYRPGPRRWLRCG